MNQTIPDQRQRKKSDFLYRATYGQVISINFFLRHWLIVISVMGLVIFYIAGNYMVRENRDEIERLRRQLAIVKTERIRVRENYMSRIRESSMTQMIDSLELDLRIQNETPYYIDIENVAEPVHNDETTDK